jgi:hypothetical protein
MRFQSLSRCLSVLAVAGVLAALPAMETPLVMPAGNNTGIIDPGLGTITTVEFSDKGSQRKGFANWLFDLDQLERYIVGERNGETFSALRTGSPTCKPSPEDYIKLFPSKPTPKQVEANQKDTQAQVREAEKAFWEKPVPFDGVIRGAFTGQYLMLVIPAKRVILFYQTTGKETVELMSYTNYSPVLYTQTAWKSTPDPAQMIKQLNLDDDERKALEGALAARADGGAPQAAKSDVWCATIGGGFVVVDSANQKIWSYEVKGQNMELTSVRSMTVDLMAPGFKTTPTDQDGVDAFSKAYGPLLRSLGVDKLDAPFVQALIRNSRVGDSGKAGSFQASATKDTVVLDFTAQNKLLGYIYRPGAGLELSTVRDSTVDQGLTLLFRQMKEQEGARKAYEKAAETAGKHDAAGALTLLSYALGLDPTLHKDAEKSSALKTELKADWDRLMADATKAEEALLAKREKIRKDADAERERLANKKKKK